MINMGLATHGGSEFAHCVLMDLVYSSSMVSFILRPLSTPNISPERLLYPRRSNFVQKSSVSSRRPICLRLNSHLPSQDYPQEPSRISFMKCPQCFAKPESGTVTSWTRLPATNGSLVPPSSIRTIYWVFQEH